MEAQEHMGEGAWYTARSVRLLKQIRELPKGMNILDIKII